MTATSYRLPAIGIEKFLSNLWLKAEGQEPKAGLP